MCGVADEQAIPRLLTVDETAERLAISRAMLYKLIKRGAAPITPVQIGRRLRFRSVDLERFLLGDNPAAHSNGATADGNRGGPVGGQPDESGSRTT